MRLFRSIATPLILLLGLAGCGSGETPTVMPGVTGLQLDVALSDIERAGFADEVEVLGGGMFGVVDEANWVVCEQEPGAGRALDSAPRLTVDRSCGSDGPNASEVPVDDPEASEAAADEPTEAAAAYSYDGPAYEVVTVDDGLGPALLTQYWVHVSDLDVATGAYRDQIRAIITDVAHAQGTAALIVQVVTDPEIIEAESESTIEAFMEEHGADYFRDVVAPKEATDWVASYTGGYDPDAGEPSDAAAAFEIVWWAYGDTDIEKWRPEGL